MSVLTLDREEELLSTADREPDERELVCDLVRAAQAGERQAFGELVDRFQRAVYGQALRRLGNHAEAQELTQEVFVQALRKIDQLRQPECFGGWLRSITSRLAINRLSRRGPDLATAPETLDGICVERETPLGNALASERALLVREGLQRLGSLDRLTLEAFYIEGQSLAEMSVAFSSPIGTIKRRLHVARKRLAQELEEFALA